MYQRPFVKDTACLFLMRMMVVSSLVEVNVSVLVHTRQLSWTVGMKENKVSHSVGESWSLVEL